MKKKFAQILAIFLMVSLCACGDNSETPNIAQPTETPSVSNNSSSAVTINKPYLGKWRGETIAVKLMQQRSIRELLPANVEYKEEDHASLVKKFVSMGYLHVGYDKAGDYIDESDTQQLRACRLTFLDSGTVIMEDLTEHAEFSRKYRIVYEAEQLFSETDDDTAFATCFYYEKSTGTLYMNSDLGIISFIKEK